MKSLLELPVVDIENQSHTILQPGFHRLAITALDYLASVTKHATQRLGGNACALCDMAAQEIAPEPSLDHFYRCIAKARYEYWDAHGLEAAQGHTMLVPKRHVAFVRDFTRPEKDEYYGFLEAIEPRGVAAYKRPPSSPSASIPEHAHTHLFLPTRQTVKKVEFDAHGGLRVLELNDPVPPKSKHKQRS